MEKKVVAKRQKLWAKARRIELMMLLGYCCKECGREEELEFDCIEPQGDKHHKLDTERRMIFYWRQHEKGNIQILCERCHTKKSAEEFNRIPF